MCLTGGDFILAAQLTYDIKVYKSQTFHVDIQLQLVSILATNSKWWTSFLSRPVCHWATFKIFVEKHKRRKIINMQQAFFDDNALLVVWTTSSMGLWHHHDSRSWFFVTTSVLWVTLRHIVAFEGTPPLELLSAGRVLKDGR